MDWSLSRAISGSPSQPGPISSALMQGSPEEEYLRSLDPVAALRMTKELQNARVYSPDEATANQWQTAKDIGYSTPIVGNVMSAMDVPQGVRDVAQRSSQGDTQGARKAMIGTELSMLGTIPFAPFGGTMGRATEGAASSTRIFAGPMAKTANHVALSRAAEMEAQGAHPDEIWQATGWGRGADGKWKWEISDHAAKIADENYLGGGITSFSRLDHPEFEAAYGEQPPIAGFIEYGKRARGQYLRDAQSVEAQGGNSESAKSVALHEFQHHVQELENSARGGNPSEMSTWVQTKALAAQKYDAMKKAGVDLSDDDIRANAESEATYEMYKRLAGETEARNVQSRQHMSPEQRRAMPPWLTQDVPDDLQIVRKR